MSVNNQRNLNYRVCSVCVMDTTDPNIRFDINGVCNHCNNFYNVLKPDWDLKKANPNLMKSIVEKIKIQSSRKEYDCILGISGGVDSSYLAYYAKEVLGLRILLLHVDAGWNSQEAVNNIERIVDSLNLDLITEVVNWEEMRDLQLAFFKASVPHLDSPQDHVFIAGLYNQAAKHGIKYILNGGNYSTECIREPLEWHYHASDLRQIKDIHRKFGTKKLKTLPMAGILKYRIYYRYFLRIKVIQPLNYIEYKKEDAIKFLETKFGWKRYSHKHYESRFTKFYEGYWLIRKFGFDKRKAHFSSLILTGQKNRNSSLEELKNMPIDSETSRVEYDYIASKLNISTQDLITLEKLPNKSFRDYKSMNSIIAFAIKTMKLLGMEKRVIQ
jgi:N-acetyl sugar amidotransferase